ncbi:unnamed protein product [Sphagnum balticum]
MVAPLDTQPETYKIEPTSCSEVNNLHPYDYTFIRLIPQTSTARMVLHHHDIIKIGREMYRVLLKGHERMAEGKQMEAGMDATESVNWGKYGGIASSGGGQGRNDFGESGRYDLPRPLVVEAQRHHPTAKTYILNLAKVTRIYLRLCIFCLSFYSPNTLAHPSVLLVFAGGSEVVVVDVEGGAGGKGCLSLEGEYFVDAGEGGGGILLEGFGFFEMGGAGVVELGLEDGVAVGGEGEGEAGEGSEREAGAVEAGQHVV